MFKALYYLIVIAHGDVSTGTDQQDDADHQQENPQSVPKIHSPFQIQFSPIHSESRKSRS